MYPTCGVCDRERETGLHVYAEGVGTVHFRVKEQKSPGESLRWFSEKFYLRYLYDENKLKYEELKTTPDPMGRAGQQPPDNG